MMKGINHDDKSYSFSRVPVTSKFSFFNVTLVRMGMATSLAQFMLGATLGHSMTFFQAMLATFLGSLILIFVSFGLGYAGMREGLSTSLLARWCGFGKVGSMLIGLAISISLLGWFGVNISMISQSLMKAMNNNVNFFWCAVITGSIFTVLVAFGFRALSITAKIAVPLFLLILFWLCFNEILGPGSGKIESLHSADNSLSLEDGATMVAGLFIVGALITPDISRYCKDGKQVFWMITLSVIVGEFIVNGIAILVAHALGTADVVEIMMHSAGWIGFLTIVLSAIKVNDINLYSSSLGMLNSLEIVTGKKCHYAALTIVLGLIGTLLSVTGILDHFVGFLIILGVLFPPIAGIMLVDYYILRTHRELLNTTRHLGVLPDAASTPVIGWPAIVAWIAGSAVGFGIDWGIASLNSLLAASIVYWGICIIKLGRESQY